MGQEIVYCYKCQQRILGAEFGKGRAYQVGHHVCCANCAPALLETLGPAERKELITQMYKAMQGHAPASGVAPASTPGSDRRMSTAQIPIVRTRPRGDGKSSLFLVAGSVGAVLLVVIILSSLSSSGSREPEPRPESPRAVPAPSVRVPGPPPATPPEDPAIQGARAALERARSFESANPKHFEAVMSRWEEAVKAAEQTPFLREATKERDRVMTTRRDVVSKELSVLEERASASLRAEEFQVAIDLFHAARAKYGFPEWSDAIDRRSREIREIAAQRYPSIRESALLARKAGRAADLELVRARIRKWNLPEFSTDLETSLSSATPDPATEGWQPLFAGPDLSGWEKVSGQPRIEGDVLILDGIAELQRRIAWADFEIEGSVQVPQKTHISGGTLSFRRPGTRRDPPMVIFHADGDIHIIDGPESRTKTGNGALPAGTWHAFSLRVVGGELSFAVGGKALLRAAVTRREAGKLALYGQEPESRIRFKDLRIREIR